MRGSKLFRKISIGVTLCLLLLVVQTASASTLAEKVKEFTFANGLTWHWTDCKGDGFGSRAEPDWPQHRMGITFEGTQGWVFIWRGTVDAHPKSLLDVRIGPHDRVRLRAPGGEPIPDFVECIRQRRRTCAPVEVAHQSTTMCSLGAISMLLGRKIDWDADKGEFVDDDQANLLRSRAMRQPWRI